MRNMKKWAALFTGAALLLTGLTACSDSEPEEKYVSPNFEYETVKAGEQYTESTETPDVVPSGLSDGEPVDASNAETDINSTGSMAGTYEDNVYYNPFAGFAIKVDGVMWRFYNAAEVASVTGLTEDEVNRQWLGVVSPYSVKNMTCAIAYDASTGTNLIVSYVNPKLYYMQDMSAREYLTLSAQQYNKANGNEDAEVVDMDYLDDTWSSLTIPEEREGFGRRTQLAIRKQDIIILITYTLQGDDTLEDAASHVSKLILQ